MGRPRRRIVSISRLVERKGVHTLIEALPLVLADSPDAELVIAGGPDERELDGDPHVQALRSAAREHGVEDRVRFVGRVARADVPALMRSADVVAVVPWYEPFGIVPLEAMACGVPVVATAVGGQIDSVVHDLTGLHVPPRDADALGAALATLLADPERRAAMGRAGRRRAERQFGWPRVARATKAVYEQVVARRASRSARGATA
jgi:D-inositol-3-phosphate glycosyltransferase